MSADNLSIQTAANTVDSVKSYLPEPSVNGVGLFNDAMDIAKSLGKTLVGGVDTALTGDFAELLQMQIQAQKEMQAVTMVSNIEKSKHESKMAALRNMRVG